jgi:ubiquinol-cytochrome c reductase iron-sulfur subunit
LIVVFIIHVFSIVWLKACHVNYRMKARKRELIASLFHVEVFMAENAPDLGRRRFLTATCAVVGGVGGVFAAVPFFSSFLPSAKAVSAGVPTTVDISKLSEGAQLIEVWRKRPVWIIKRSEESLAALDSIKVRLKDAESSEEDQQPKYAKNGTRSIKPKILVLVGSCTHLGCSPKYFPEMKAEDWDSEWKGGFYCPCHSSKFDMAGRVFNGSPAPTNLVVPIHRYVDDNTIVIGEEQEAA